MSDAMRGAGRGVRAALGLAGVAVALWVGCTRAEAQTVVAQVRDEGTGEVVVGALVELEAEGGAVVARGLTDGNGRVVLWAQEPGRYRLRAERIGYAAGVARDRELSLGETVREDIALRVAPLSVKGFEVEGIRRCRMEEDGALVAQLWSEASRTLRNQVEAGREQRMRFRVTEYERELDVQARVVLGEERVGERWVMGAPFASPPVAELLEQGFIRGTEEDGWEYFGPDAQVLLSDGFVERYCFGLELQADDEHAVGLAFRPVERGAGYGIVGTLWLDAKTGVPRYLEFGYTRSPWVEAEGHARGRVEFEELANGLSVVGRWWLRMPKMVRDPTPRARGTGLSVGSLVEVGAEVVEVASPDGNELVRAPSGSVTGTVWDSIAGGPLAGAEVYVAGTSHTARTDSLGRFRMAPVAVGRHRVVFWHPRLDAVGIYPRGLEVTVEPEAEAVIHVGVPSAETVLAALCGDGALRAGTSAVVVGIVRESAGGMPAAATVRLEWQLEAEGSAQTLELKTDEWGRYRACGVPAEVPVAARASTAEGAEGVEGAIRRLTVGGARVGVLDLTLEPATTERAEAVGACAAATAGATGTVVGRVRDATADVPIGGVSVWLVPAAVGEARSVQADAAGAFAFCDVPAGEYLARVSIRRVGEGSQTLRVQAGAETPADLALLLEGRAGAEGEIGGRVLAAEGRRPLAGAQIQLADGRTQTTGAEGGFTFKDVAAGTVELKASSLGYQEGTGSVVLGSGQSLTLEILLSPRPFELDPIVVTAVRAGRGGMLDDVRRRAASPWGTVLLGEALERRLRSVTHVVDIFHEYGGDVFANGTGLIFRRTGCAPHVYIDGIRVTHIPRRKGSTGLVDNAERTAPNEEVTTSAQEAAEALDLAHPATIYAIEIYRGPAETPGEFLDSDAQCGVVLVWTRRGTG